MLGRFVIVLALAGCGAKEGSESGGKAAGAVSITVEDEDRGCVTDAGCTAILTECSMCEGACTGVRVDRAARYQGRLDCSKYSGAVCNYDCRPRFHIEEPRCVQNRCESVRIPRK